MTKLHLGCGPLHLSGWVNIDNAQYPGVDRVLDVTAGLPFENVSFVFAEHFIEHIAYPSAANLLRECRPNLDWVWMTHYRLAMEDPDAVHSCFMLNRAFRGWGHQFLYNEQTLRAMLLDAGFAMVKRVEYGVSEHAELRALERHERSPDYGSLSDILIVEASGRGGAAPSYFDSPRTDFLRDLGVT